MTLSKEQVNALRTHLETVLIKADSTHDIKERLTIIIEGLHQISTFTKYTLPDDIKLLLGRLEGRAYSPRVFQSEHHRLMHTACRLIRLFIPSSNYTLSKEHELVDELVHLLVPAAVVSFQAKISQRIISCLFQVDEGELNVDLSIRHTSPVSRQLVYMFKTADDYITALYCPFIDVINRYACNQHIDELVCDCTDLLEKPEYDHMLSSFSLKLSELAAYAEAESPAVGFTLIRKQVAKMTG